MALSVEAVVEPDRHRARFPTRSLPSLARLDGRGGAALACRLVIFSPAMAAATVLLAGLLDVVCGEPPNAIHPVAWLGRLVALLERGAPHERPRAELAYGVAVVVVVTGIAAAVGLALVLALSHLPWWLALPAGAVALKVSFSLRGLVGAGRTVQRTLDADPAAAREGLRALVSRDRDLTPSQVASAAIESLAENLSDSVVAPLLFFALLGLPGAFAYRAVNTLDAMIGYHGRYEYLGKTAARLDDVLNLVPARLSGLLIVALACLRRRGAAAFAGLRRERRLSSSPNKLWTIAPMAGALGVQLEKPGTYAVGPDTRPLRAAIIGEAAVLVWAAGVIAIVATAGLAALLAGWWV
jgi:adenosylcobinamide-phosphate synthase